MTYHSLHEDEIANIAWHAASFENDMAALLDSKAIDIIDWQGIPEALTKRQPNRTDLHKYQDDGVRFWLTRFALAAHLSIENEARISATAAREWGARWEDVGDTIGMSKQGAHQRYRSES